VMCEGYLSISAHWHLFQYFFRFTYLMWQPAKENTALSPKTDPLWPLSNSKVSSCR
jgi:hypothetical protein